MIVFVHAVSVEGFRAELQDIVFNKTVYLSVCRDVQKQKALVKNESLLTILSGETLLHFPAHNSI